MKTPSLSEFTTRLVTLGEGQRGLRGGLRVEVREPALVAPANSNGATSGTSSPDPKATGANASAVLDFIASTERLDRTDEVIAASGWRLDNYRRNPVFQNAHQYGDIIFTLGRALITEVRTIAAPGGQTAPRSVLFQRIEFATEVNPVARIAYGLYKGKFLNAVSVGFIPLRWENGGPKDSYRRKYLEQELLEVSAVGIPANPEALQLAVKAGAVERRDLRESLDLVRALAAAERIRPADERSAELVRRGQELVRLARRLSEAMR